jgi:chromosome segregation ATPase
MSEAARKPKPQPLTVAELEKALEHASHLLLLAQRTNSAARSALPGLLASGDTDAIAECRREISESARQVQEFGESADSYREAIESAQRRDHLSFNARQLQQLERLLKKAVDDHIALERAIVEFAKSIATARASAEAAENELTRAGVTYDRFLSLAVRMMGRVDMSIWLETEGVMGRCPTLDTQSQSRASGKASLEMAANEFRGYVLKNARQVLGVAEVAQHG